MPSKAYLVDDVSIVAAMNGHHADSAVGKQDLELHLSILQTIKSDILSTKSTHWTLSAHNEGAQEVHHHKYTIQSTHTHKKGVGN